MKPAFLTPCFVSRWGMLLMVACAAMCGGCFDVERVTGGPPVGYETTIDACTDGRDNDQDGFVDCEDSDCIARNFCGENVPAIPPSGFEADVESCSDGIDNDENGQFDCGDRKCQAIQELCCVTEFTNDRCQDHIDNDGNGFSDCEDFACRNGVFTTACRRESNCTDGFDNDNDGFTDCEDLDCARSAGCVRPSMPEDNFERCTDGIDNDNNGFLDCREFSCCPSSGPCITPEIQTYCDDQPSEDDTASCIDGVDNDNNGFFDCGEFGCCDRDGVCIDNDVQTYCDAQPSEDTFELCTDGIDNDDNGFFDCNDNSCSMSGIAELGDLCEASYASCIDHIDNDGDGFLDCSDRSCEGVREVVPELGAAGAVSPCLESVYTLDDVDESNPNTTLAAIRRLTLIACTDGIDGDSDGFIDCEDWDCQWNPLLNPQVAPEGLTRLTGVPVNPEERGLCQRHLFNSTSGHWEPTDNEVRIGLSVDVLHCE